MTKQTHAELVARRVAVEISAEMRAQQKTGIQLAEVLEMSQHTAGTRLRGSVPFTVIELASTAQWLGLPLREIIARAERALMAVAS